MAPILQIPVDHISSILHTYNDTPATNRVAIAARSIQGFGSRHPTVAKAVLIVIIFVVAFILVFVFFKAMQRSIRQHPGPPAMPSGHVYGGSLALGPLSGQSWRCERPHHRHLENRPLNNGTVSGGRSTASVTRPEPVVTRAPERRDEIESPPPPPYPAPPKYEK